MSEEKSPIFYAPGNDPAMRTAVDQARESFRFFWRELSWERRRIIPGLDLACIKVPFSDATSLEEAPDNGIEEMWVSDVDFDGQKVRGTLINEPNFLTSVGEGDEIQVAVNEISDWMYGVHERVYGAYTVNVIRSTMSDRERQQHDDAWGLDFGDPAINQIVPPSYLGEEEEIIEEPKKGFFASIFGGTESKRIDKPQTVEQVAAHEHPMALNMGPSLEEMLEKNPENISTTDDDHGFTFLHQLALAGTVTGVRILIQRGADVNAKANNGMTPLALANSLHWSDVAQLLNENGATV